MKILIPVDFSENSKRALEFAIFLARKKNASITILHIIEAIYDFAAQAAVVIEGMHRDAEMLLEEMVKTYDESGVTIDFLIKEGTISIMTAKTAEELDVNFIVIGMQGSSGITKKLLGNSTIEIVKESTKPVLLIPSEANVTQIQKVTLALEFADHEEAFLKWIIEMSQRWELNLEFLHIQTKENFQEKLSLLGLERFIKKNHPDLAVKLHTFYAAKLDEGLNKFLEENETTILVMCHQHKNLWEQILSRSKSIQMAYHTHVPLLIMN